MNIWYLADIQGYYSSEEDDFVKLDKDVHYTIYEDKPDYCIQLFEIEYDIRQNQNSGFKGYLRTGLAKYILPSNPLFNKVFAIDYKVYKGQCLFTCNVIDKFDDIDSENLINYLNGQISDGWGENGIYVNPFLGSEFLHIFVDDNVKRVYRAPIHINENGEDYIFVDSEEKEIEYTNKYYKKILNKE